jgi:DNA-binding NtrC family response regulator
MQDIAGTLAARRTPPPRRAGARARSPAARKSALPAVLIVEDEILIRLAVAAHLRDAGFRVFEASGPAEAQEVMQSRAPVDVVFSDIMMPGDVDGLALAAWIRREHPATRIVLTSGVPQAIAAAHARSDDIPLIEKPYDYDALVDLLRQLTAAAP